MLGGSGNSFYLGEGGELGIPNIELCKATLNLYLLYTNYLLYKVLLCSYGQKDTGHLVLFSSRPVCGSINMLYTDLVMFHYMKGAISLGFVTECMSIFF